MIPVPVIVSGLVTLGGALIKEYFDTKRNRDNNIASVVKTGIIVVTTGVTVSKIFGNKSETSMKIGHGDSYLQLQGRK